MVRPCALLCAFSLLSFSFTSAASEDQASPSPPADDASLFVALKAAGDASFLRRSWAPAARAYRDALKLRSDPTLHGRLGVIAAQTPALALAADHLLVALEGNGGITDAERIIFATELARIRPKVCLVHVVLNVMSAELGLDADTYAVKGSRRSVFVMPGEHRARASADGYKDASTHFEAPAGEEVTITLTLERPELPLPAHPAPEVEMPPLFSDGMGSPAGGPNNSPAVGGPDVPPFRVEAMLGAAVSPYGMPSVGVGGNGMLAVRWPRFALAIDMRGLITPASGIGDVELPGRASLVSGTLLPCVASKFLDVCGVIAASFVSFDLAPPLTVSTADGFSVGFGARVVGRWQFSERFALIGYGDVTLETRSIVLRSPASTPGAEPTNVWRSPQARLTFGIGVAADIVP